MAEVETIVYVRGYEWIRTSNRMTQAEVYTYSEVMAAGGDPKRVKKGVDCNWFQSDTSGRG